MKEIREKNCLYFPLLCLPGSFSNTTFCQLFPHSQFTLNEIIHEERSARCSSHDPKGLCPGLLMMAQLDSTGGAHSADLCRGPLPCLTCHKVARVCCHCSLLVPSMPGPVGTLPVHAVDHLLLPSVPCYLSRYLVPWQLGVGPLLPPVPQCVLASFSNGLWRNPLYPGGNAPLGHPHEAFVPGPTKTRAIVIVDCG